ncbi:Emopamil-binding protein [Trichodelitschia bisporula]|uniref:Emopamil-binding protein n=1 Tax=Trichodelitschia bisporula TaxID=703511 RepID=A0A6G1HXL8_9PEZI|nr:Emopamil-binding protein [Trichodelitschia bisporula]
MSESKGLVIDEVTVLSLLATVVLLIVAYVASLRLLPASASTRSRVLFVWHSFDALIHFFFEGSFLYNCFFTFINADSVRTFTASTGRQSVAVTASDVHFLGRADKIYGANYGTGPTSKLWQEYAKADRRWGEADLGVISLELLTVLIGGPLAVWICVLLSRGHGDIRGMIGGKLAFWMIVLATGELYGGFMTFAPEWLTGSPNLDTSNFMYLWVYLFFFNTLWVWIPLWILVQSYFSIASSMPVGTVQEGKKKA